MNFDWGKNFGLLWLRILMGAGIASHGYAKIFSGGMSGFIQIVAGLGMPYPEFFAWCAALSELLGGILILAGLTTRLAAFFVAVTMSVAAFDYHSADPFSTKELALTYGVMAVCLILMGAGAISFDRLLGMVHRHKPGEHGGLKTGRS